MNQAAEKGLRARIDQTLLLLRQDDRAQVLRSGAMLRKDARPVTPVQPDLDAVAGRPFVDRGCPRCCDRVDRSGTLFDDPGYRESRVILSFIVRLYREMQPSPRYMPSR